MFWSKILSSENMVLALAQDSANQCELLPDALSTFTYPKAFASCKEVNLQLTLFPHGDSAKTLLKTRFSASASKDCG